MNYKEIANAIIFGRMEIEGLPFHRDHVYQYIEGMHKRSEFKEEVFYTSLMRNMIAPDAIRNAPHWEQTNNVIRGVIEYCKSKVNEKHEVQPDQNKKILPQPVIALIHVYRSIVQKNEAITDSNKNKIASDFEYKKKTSGKSLIDCYYKYRKTQERISLPQKMNSANLHISYMKEAEKYLRAHNEIKEADMAKTELEALEEKFKKTF